MSELERTGWRCEKISQRHRDWGYNCPAVDLDFIVTEYNHGKPVALVEYKEKHAASPDLTHPTYKALKDLADNYSPNAIPFLIAIYCPDDWWFKVIPVNQAAIEYYKHVSGQFITEQRFVKSLYLLRKTVLEASDIEAISKLKNVVP